MIPSPMEIGNPKHIELLKEMRQLAEMDALDAELKITCYLCGAKMKVEKIESGLVAWRCSNSGERWCECDECGHEHLSKKSCVGELVTDMAGREVDVHAV